MASFKICLMCSRVADKSLLLDEALYEFLSMVLLASNLPRRICFDCHEQAAKMLSFKQQCVKSICKIRRICPDLSMILGGSDIGQDLSDWSNAKNNSKPKSDAASSVSSLPDSRRTPTSTVKECTMNGRSSTHLTPLPPPPSVAQPDAKPMEPKVQQGDHSRPDKRLFKCTFCAKSLKSPHGLHYHLKRGHPEMLLKIVDNWSTSSLFDPSNDRHAMVYSLWSTGASGVEIRRQLMQKFGEYAMSRRAVYHLIDQFRKME